MKKIFILAVAFCAGWANVAYAQDMDYILDSVGVGSIEADPNTGKLYEIVLDLETGKLIRQPADELQEHLVEKIKQQVDVFNYNLKELWAQPNPAWSHSDVNAFMNKKKHTLLPETLKLFINNGKEKVVESPVIRIATQDVSSGIWYYIDGGVSNDISNDRLIPIFVVKEGLANIIIGSRQSGIWYEYKDEMESTTLAELKKNYPDGKEMKGYLVSSQDTIPAARVAVASVSRATGKKKVTTPRVEVYLNNVAKATSYRQVDMEWKGCKVGKFKKVNDSTFECTATYTMYFRGHRRDVNVDYGDKTTKTVKIQITYKKTGPTERWIVLLGDIKVDEIVPLPSTKGY